MSTFFRKPLFLMIAGGVLLGGIMIFFLMFRVASPFPDDVQRQITFSVLYPGASSDYEVDAKSIAYMPKDKVLIFHVKNGSNGITLTQQATPDPFNDIPDYYTKVVEELHGYASFDSVHGKVALTHPEELKGGQSALFNGKGTLLFAHPAKALSDDEWRSFFKSLVLL